MVNGSTKFYLCIDIYSFSNFWKHLYKLWCRENYSDALKNITLAAIESLRATYFRKVGCESGINLFILMKLFDDLIDRIFIQRFCEWLHTKLLILKM